MKLKIPYLKRERYIVLKVYTSLHYLAEKAPIVVSKKAVPAFPDIGPRQSGFQTCYGFVGSLKRSATIFSPCDFHMTCDGEDYVYTWPPQMDFHVINHNDQQWSPRDMFVSKLRIPFAVECNKPETHFVMGSHILNDTEMHIPTGVITFDHMADCNIFNYIPKKPLEYFVPFKKPLAQLYPLSDLPLHVECEFNLEKFESLRRLGESNCAFRNSHLKLMNTKKL